MSNERTLDSNANPNDEIKSTGNGNYLSKNKKKSINYFCLEVFVDN